MKSTVKILIIFSILVVFTSIQINAIQNKGTRNLKYHRNNYRFSHKADPVADLGLPKRLPDDNSDGFCEYSEFTHALKNHHMTQGEIRNIFHVVDRARNGKINGDEWYHFFKIFVTPFVLCDTDKDYYLDKEELTKCFTTEDHLSGTVLDPLEIDNVIEALDRTKDNQINFADYMFLRKVNLAWKECAVDDQISKQKIGCAMAITAPGRILDLPDSKMVFDLGVTLKDGKSVGQTAHLSFVEFLSISHIYYYFTEFEIPYQDGSLSKKEVLRAIDDSILPTTLTPKIINDMYGSFEELDFAAWSGLLYAYRIFIRHSKENFGTLNMKEFNDVLAEKSFNQPLLKIIDGFYNPNQAEIEEASLRRGNRPITEKDYLINFLQVSKTQIKHKEDAVDLYVDTNRNIVYKIFDISHKGQLTYGNFVKFIKLSWAFQNYESANSGNFVNDKNINEALRKHYPPIPFQKDESRYMADLADFLAGFRSYSVDIKELYIWFMAEEAYSLYKIQGSQCHTSTLQINQGSLHLGLRLAESTLGLAQEGTDPILDDATYNYKILYKMAFEDEIIAIRIKNNLPAEQVKEDPAKK